MRSKILLLGSNGYLGARIYQDLHMTLDIVPQYHSSPFWENSIQLDITDPIAVEKTVKELKPDYIVHTANNGSGSWCESHPEEAKNLNEKATSYIADVAMKHQSHLIYISSLAVLNPRNIYGKTKKNSEEIIQKSHGKWTIIRPSYIVGMSPNVTNDRPFNRILKAMSQDKPTYWDTSWEFQPTYIGHISQVVERIVRRNITGKIIPIFIKEVVTQYKLAKDILSNFKKEVQPKNDNLVIPLSIEKPRFFEELNIKDMSYKEMITVITQEIKAI
ncbi:MAG: sugar nucleotide-binding protein [Candidatus Pacebacteria bacterium]|nr:sugar nucleotide-binding protein [Candidatus Paceibacterota bacterium]